MEQEETVGVKALRARFQEEPPLAQSKNIRPAIAEKPKGIPLSGGHSCSVVNSINATGDGNPSVAPRVIFRDGLRLSGGKCPISIPPPHSTSLLPPQSGSGETSTRQSFKERNMPLVLPALPAKEWKMESAATKEQKRNPKPPGELSQSIKAKKKVSLLPVKSNKSSKVNAGDGEEPMYADLTIRSTSGVGELPSGEREKTEDRISLQGDSLTCSPDGLITPPSTDASGESSSGTGGSQFFDQRFMSTLERTKKKFSPRQLLTYTRPKSFRPNGVQSPNSSSADKTLNLSSKDVETIKQDLPSPPSVCLPHLACVSARPFVKTKGPARRVEPALDRQHCSQSVQFPLVWPDGPQSPLKKPLPDLKSLGPSPVKPPKPPRPPRVDLSIYKLTPPQEISPHVDNGEVPEPEQLSITIPDAPEFPDFNTSAVEAGENCDIDIAALEFEAIDFDSLELPAPVDFGVPHIESPGPELPGGEPVEPAGSERNFGLILEDNDAAAVPDPLNLLGIPEPVNLESWSQNEDKVLAPVPESQTETTEQLVLGDPTTEEVENCQTAVSGEMQPQTSACLQGSYYETYDNVYEDVENVNKFISSQHSRKRKGSPKNPYADQPLREEARLNIWPRNPWGDRGHSVHGRGHSFHGYGHRKNCQSPHTSEYKDQKKKEKHRLEKEKKEQREREKKENEMKKKFKVTGQEKPLYHAKVTVASKVRKHDLPVKSGDTVSIIRTTNCPKGKWLARDTSNKYGYISVMNVELNIKEMLELGKKAQAAGKDGDTDIDAISIGSRSSNHLLHTSSFTDDSDEEWTCEHETLSPSTEGCSLLHQSDSVPETLCHHAGAQHTLSDAVLEDLHTQNRHEALQKLAIFFEHKKPELNDDVDNGEPTPTNAEPSGIMCSADDPPYLDQEVDIADFELLPPPPLYADAF